MAVAFEDLLSSLCSEITPQHANDFQKIYLISDAREAKLAFDVLVAHGFDAKVYPDGENGSKLYITPPPETDTAAEQKLAAAMAYARTVSDIKDCLDVMCEEETTALSSPDYSMTFANLPPNNKQINIVLTQAAAVAQAASPVSAAAPARPAAAQRRVLKKKLRRKKQEDHFSAGPTLGKRYYAGALGDQAKAEQNSFKRQAFLYLTGNAATGGFVFIAIVAGASIVFTLLVLAKSFLCPDFAMAKIKQSHAWYCEQNDQ